MRGLLCRHKNFFPILIAFFMATLTVSEGKAEKENHALRITPLPLLRVDSHPQIHPLVEETTLSEDNPTPKREVEDEIEEKSELKSLSAHTDERVPLGFITVTQDLQNQKWYLFAAAKRGMRNPNNIIEVISTGETQEISSKAEAVKNLLVDMGISPEQIHVFSAKIENEGEEGNPILEEKIYLFSKEIS